MADKAISELTAASQVTPTDLFVLEQSGKAKKLTGQTLENWLLSMADGHGGIQSIVKKSTSGLDDTYRITLSDTTVFDFVVTNGKAISSVKQTAVSGLTRTYTIAFNDGTSQTFNVTDGKDGEPGEKGESGVYTLAKGETIDDAPEWAQVVVDPYSEPPAVEMVATLDDGTTKTIALYGEVVE